MFSIIIPTIKLSFLITAFSLSGSEKRCEVHQVADGVWKITSTHRSEPHLVNSLRPSCTCRSFMRTHFPCRHILQLLDEGFLEWSNLPKDYVNIPFFTKDRYPGTVIPRFTGPQSTGALGLPGLSQPGPSVYRASWALPVLMSPG